MNIEKPKPMSSAVTETVDKLTIITPAKKSWLAIIFSAALLIQFSIALIKILFLYENLTVSNRVAFVAVCLIIICLAGAVFMWQIFGKTGVIIDDKTLVTTKSSPVWSTSKVYRLSDIGLAGVKHEAVAEGPLAMLQLLRIADSVKIVIGYGYETISIIGGVDRIEAVELRDIINNKLKSVG